MDYGKVTSPEGKAGTDTGEEQPTGAAPEAVETEQAAETDGNPPEADTAQEQTVEIDGEQVPLSQVVAWKKGHLMQEDYTRKTQELAREREALKSWQQFARTYAEDKELQAYIAAYKKQAAKDAVANGGNGQTRNPMEEELRATRAEIEAIKKERSQERMDRAVDSGLSSLASTYKDVASKAIQDEILKIALDSNAYKMDENGKIDFEPAYEIWSYRKQKDAVAKARAQGKAEGAEAQAARSEAVTGSARTVGGVPASSDTPLTDRLRVAAARLKRGGMNYSGVSR